MPPRRLVAIPQAVAAARPPRDCRPVALQGAAMGTGWSVKAFLPPDLPPPGLSPPALQQAVEAELAAVIAEISHWEPGSELSRFNAAPAGSWHRVSRGFLAVLDCALRIAAESGGAFDPGLGGLVERWGFGPSGPVAAPPAPPPAPGSDHVPGWQALEVDREGGRVRQPGGLCLDLSAIGKGHAVDRVAARLRGLGAASFLVEVGGELRGEGVKPDGSPWWVAIDRPPGTDPGGDEVLVALAGLSVATSGDYVRQFRHDGRIYGHLMDPRAAAPLSVIASGAVAAVSVLAPGCMEADALATALAVLGPEAGLAHADRHGIAALFRLADGSLRGSAAFTAMLD